MIIQSTKVFIAGQFMPAQIELRDGKIADIKPYGQAKVNVDYGGRMILPGFIDIHTHGMMGYSADEPKAEGLVRWLQALPREGVTSFLPTTTSQTREVTVEAVKNIAAVKESNERGAQILGVHLEGPFLDHTYRGMHTPSWLRNPSLEEFQAYEKISQGLIKRITVACEHDQDHALIRYASQRGVSVSIGHTGTSFEGALLALANGATSFTHSFNAMTGLHHRQPGVAGALLASNAFAEIICDGHHVHSAVVKILFNAKGMSNLIMISDAIGVKGLPEGDYEISNIKVNLDKEGTARNYGTETIAGSSLKMNDGIRFLVEEASVPLEQAIITATLNPAKALGLENSKGQIKFANDADLTVLNGDYSVKATYCLGELVWG